jgi:hypothetical protein
MTLPTCYVQASNGPAIVAGHSLVVSAVRQLQRRRSLTAKTLSDQGEATPRPHANNKCET